MAREESIIRFEGVSFEYGHSKPILYEVSFAVRRGMKLAIMGQNGAGKSTIFALMTGRLTPESGRVLTTHGLKVATAPQVIPREEVELTIRAFFAKRFDHPVYDIDPRIDRVLEVVGLVLPAPHERIVRSLSGGQQARLLLASALIQAPERERTMRSCGAGKTSPTTSSTLSIRGSIS